MCVFYLITVFVKIIYIYIFFPNDISFPSTMCIYTLIPNGIFKLLQQSYPNVFSIQTKHCGYSVVYILLRKLMPGESSVLGTKRRQSECSSPWVRLFSLYGFRAAAFFWSILVATGLGGQ